MNLYNFKNINARITKIIDTNVWLEDVQWTVKMPYKKQGTKTSSRVFGGAEMRIEGENGENKEDGLA